MRKRTVSPACTRMLSSARPLGDITFLQMSTSAFPRSTTTVPGVSSGSSGSLGRLISGVGVGSTIGPGLTVGSGVAVAVGAGVRVGLGVRVAVAVGVGVRVGVAGAGAGGGGGGGAVCRAGAGGGAVRRAGGL